MDRRTAKRLATPGFAAVIAISASISIGDAAVEKLVPLARLQDLPVADLCDAGPDFTYPNVRDLLPHRSSKVYRCYWLRLGDRTARFVDAIVDHVHQLAVYDVDGREIVLLTRTPFDPYQYNYSMIHDPYEIVDLDGDGSDEIVLTDALSRWTRVVAVRGHALMTTSEHPYIGGNTHPRWFYARDTLVPLSSVVAVPIGTYAYRTDTHRVIAGPRAYGWYPPDDPSLHAPCKARLEDYDDAGYVTEDR